MKRLLSALLVGLLLVLPAAADKAKGLYNKAKDAEARQDFETAYTLYQQAYQLKPKDLRYRMAFDRTRFEAASSHVIKGRKLRDQNKLEEALAEFLKAGEIDPGLSLAFQEAEKTQAEIDRLKGTPQTPPAPPHPHLAAANAEGPVELAPISNQPITLHIASDDAKVIYTTIGKLAGINVLFDPDYVSRRLSIDLNNVNLQQALEILAMESKTFWRPVTANTIFVAQDNKTKRTEIEQNVVKTVYLSNLSQTTELQDAVNVVRTVIGMQRVIQIPSQNAIVMRGTPDQVALAEKLIHDIDKAHPEVVVDVAVMQVNRSKIRELGINPPQNASVTLQSNVTTTTSSSTTGGSTTSGTGTTATPSNTGINLNQLGSLTANNFSVTIPSAAVSFLYNDSDTKVIQNPQIRAINGQKASLKIGDKVPIATGSFQPGIGGVGINPLVNTQFQYTDVGVNMDITPTVHGDNEVTLKLHMEISSVTSHVNIGGIDQPVIGQRTIDHEIRLKDGEVNLLGGIFENDEIENLTGFPFLSQVPLLKYLFSQTHKELRENEIVFVLVPHIVRSQNINDLNLRAIDVGTENTVDLRRANPAPPPQPVSAPAQNLPQAQPLPPAQAPAMRPAQPAAPAQTAVPQAGPTEVPPQAGAAQQPAAQQPESLANASAILSFDPPQITQAASSTFSVNVSIANARNVYSVPAQIAYDPRTLQLVNVSNGGFLGRDGQPVALVHREDPTGNLQITATRPPNSGGISGSGPVFTLTFLAKAAGQSTMSIVRAAARDAAMQPVPVSGGQAMVTIK